MPIIDVTADMQKAAEGSLDALIAQAQQIGILLKPKDATSNVVLDPLVAQNASDTLGILALQLEVLSKLVEYTALKVRAVTDAQPEIRRPMTIPEFSSLLDAIPGNLEPGELLYRLMRKVEGHHRIAGI